MRDSRLCHRQRRRVNTIRSHGMAALTTTQHWFVCKRGTRHGSYHSAFSSSSPSSFLFFFSFLISHLSSLFFSYLALLSISSSSLPYPYSSVPRY
ncbi:hypothetical protein N658DRAFT_57454 [Parathielavia hyrcaniae]|uniref:Uncharacterized protein n=1 Tax=Parathielavia hyrcaniae TaxID=113614 RepID=A0AAN6T268_9PEZI|nr:hypothetical protein N658DRAFT_57454 [Parathielavia hyrcaniae]